MILVLVPIKSNMPDELRRRCLRQVGELRCLLKDRVDVVVDESGPGDSAVGSYTDRLRHISKIRNALLDAYLRPEHTCVLWVDADIRFDVEVVMSMISCPNDVVAPMVLMESKDEKGKFEGKERFYDLKGFVEEGRETPMYPPFFKAVGPMVDLDSVGAFYMVPADVFRAGARYKASQGYTEHYAVCEFAKKMGRRVVCDTRLKVYHAYLPEYGEPVHETTHSDSLDPLERIHRFDVYSEEPKPLPVVSVVFENRPEMFDRIRRITEWHRRFFKFRREIVITNHDPRIPGVELFRANNLPDDKLMLWYSDMCVRGLNQFCGKDEHMLIWQWDGFVVNPEMWAEEFLKWDYIGAPVVSPYWKSFAAYKKYKHPEWKNPVKDDDAVVGNGGFSLRSKKFLEASASLQGFGESYHTEDMFLCIERRTELEAMGVKFCPTEIAAYFAKDQLDKRTVGQCFGFHSRNHFLEVKLALEEKWLK